MVKGRIRRAAGVLLGQACGDALGVPYEFDQPPASGERAEMIGGGLGPYAPGEWSDDTQMAACIAEVAATGVDLASDDALDQVAERFLDWATSGASDIGVQTRAVLANARQRSGPARRRACDAAKRYAATHTRSAGNGALMRTSIVGLSALDDPDATAAAARAIAELTHADPLAGDSCVLWSEAVRVAVVDGRLNVRAGLGLLTAERRDQWAAWLDEAESAPASSFKPNGFTVTALQAAVAAITRTPVPDDNPARGSFSASHYAEALQAAVRIGDDTDTVAAIAGGLLGAYWGVSAVPAQWRAAVHGWPGWRAGDLVAKAILTANRGIPDSTGWPNVEHLGYPQARDALAAVPHPYDAGVMLGTVHPEALDTDVVVTLCRLGTAQRCLPDVPEADRLDVWLIDSDDRAANPHLNFVLADTAAFVAARRDAGQRVYVHCVAAEQRTPSVALAYACYHGHGPQEAAEAIRRALHSTRGSGRLWEAAARVAPASASGDGGFGSNRSLV